MATMTVHSHSTRMRKASVYAIVALLAGSKAAHAQTWCGKNYMRNQTVVPPGKHQPFTPIRDALSPNNIFQVESSLFQLKAPNPISSFDATKPSVPISPTMSTNVRHS